jgi:hypothetical protein
VTPLPRSEYVSLTTPITRRLGPLRAAYGLRFTLGDTTSRLWHRLLRRDGERHELLRIYPA